MANKKLVICAALATGLLLTACVKKEEPKSEDQQEQASETQSTQTEPESQNSNSSESIPTTVQLEPVIETTREETAHTTTEIRRETRPAQNSSSNNSPGQTEQPKAVQPEPKPVNIEAPKANNSAQTEDDAVAAAIAAATPALAN